VSRRERTETIIECDGCNRGMRERDARQICGPGMDICEYCVRSLLALDKGLAKIVLGETVESALAPMRAAIENAARAR
jgi:hypothetical protein